MSDADLPFSVVERKSFLNIVQALNPRATQMMVKRKGIASEVRELYLAHQKILMQKLALIPKLSVTLNAWTSPNGNAFVGVTIHGITSKWKLINVVIGMPPIHGKFFFISR